MLVINFIYRISFTDFVLILLMIILFVFNLVVIMWFSFSFGPVFMLYWYLLGFVLLRLILVLLVRKYNFDWLLCILYVVFLFSMIFLFFFLIWLFMFFYIYHVFMVKDICLYFKLKYFMFWLFTGLLD